MSANHTNSDFPITFDYPNPEDPSRAIVSMRVFRAGNALMLAPNGELFEFEVTYSAVEEFINKMWMDTATRSRAGLHPFRESYISIINGKEYQIDSEIAEELCAVYFGIKTDNEISHLLNLYPPE